MELKSISSEDIAQGEVQPETPPLQCQGWTVYFHQIFNLQFQHLVAQVKALQTKLSKEKFVTHTSVKQLKTLKSLITNTIPSNPEAQNFSLTGELKNFSRVKKMGLGSRYRLFFKVFPNEKKIFILWLGFPRRDGDKNDCYEVFKKYLSQGKISPDLEAILAESSLYSSE